MRAYGCWHDVLMHQGGGAVKAAVLSSAPMRGKEGASRSPCPVLPCPALLVVLLLVLLLLLLLRRRRLCRLLSELTLTCHLALSTEARTVMVTEPGHPE